MQIKTTVKYLFILTMMTVVQKIKNNKCWCGNVEKSEPSSLLVGVENGAAAVENSLLVFNLQEVKHRVTSTTQHFHS